MLLVKELDLRCSSHSRFHLLDCRVGGWCPRRLA